MNLIFNKDHTVDEVFQALTKQVNDGINDGSLIFPEFAIPVMMHWVKLDSFKVDTLDHPGQIAKRIVQSLKLDSFKDCKAHIAFTPGIMHVFITDSDVIEMPAVLNMPAQGSA